VSSRADAKVVEEDPWEDTHVSYSELRPPVVEEEPEGANGDAKMMSNSPEVGREEGDLPKEEDDDLQE